ncbi:MAG: xanthine dehydrogenase family protein subunit M [Rhizobiales bacterium]|nr:xanthine dehydrogenase family protein subunit M [Hyphomicrobiales bacterium]
MKAPDVDYACPQALTEALALLGQADGDAMPLAGGQSLMPMMNFRLAAPSLLVDLNHIDELRGLSDQGDAIVIGAMTRFVELQHAELVSRHLPLMVQALPHIAHPAIRNRGTIGGSVALADPAAEMPALLLALDATVIVASLDGERAIAAGDFHRGLYETALRPGEIIKAISIPKASGNRHVAFDELARRHGDYAMVGLAATAAAAAPFGNLRLAFFGIANRALRATDAEDALNGCMPNDDQAMAAAKAAIAGLTFHGDLHAAAATKRHLAGVLLTRVLRAL